MSKYRKLQILLTAEQRSSFERVISKGTSGAMEIRRANVLLLADESSDRIRKKDVVIADMLHITPQAVHDIKRRFLDRVAGREAQPEIGIRRKRRETPPVPAKCTGDVEAKIIAIACSTPPEGFGRWTLRMISERAVELEIIDSISHTQVGRILKKTNSSLT